MAPSVRFELVQPPQAGGPGLSGLIAAADSLLPRDECPFDLHTNVLLAGLAFRTYQLDPADNHALDVASPELRWTEDAIDVDNYGALEAIGGHFGVGPRTWRQPSLKDAVALVRHELEAGRHVIAELGRAPEPRWALVTGVHAGRNTATLPRDGAPLDALEIELVPDASAAPAIAALTVIRPLPTPRSPGQSRALQHDVLVFGRRHLREKHELIHHAELFYATGLRAVARTRALVAQADGAEWQAALDSWVQRWCSELAFSRGAGSRGAATWAAALEMGDPHWRTPAGGAATIRQLAAALDEAAAAYAAAGAATTVDARVDALSLALAAEHNMASALDVLGSGGMFG